MFGNVDRALPAVDRGNLIYNPLRLQHRQGFLNDESDASIGLSILYEGKIDSSMFEDAFALERHEYFVKYRFQCAQAPFMVVLSRSCLHFFRGSMVSLYSDCYRLTDFYPV